MTLLQYITLKIIFTTLFISQQTVLFILLMYVIDSKFGLEFIDKHDPDYKYSFLIAKICGCNTIGIYSALGIIFTIDAIQWYIKWYC